MLLKNVIDGYDKFQINFHYFIKHSTTIRGVEFKWNFNWNCRYTHEKSIYIMMAIYNQ